MISGDALWRTMALAVTNNMIIIAIINHTNLVQGNTYTTGQPILYSVGDMQGLIVTC